MASCFDTHITTSAPNDRWAVSASALGADAIVMARSAADLGRTQRGLNAGGTEALVGSCART